MRLVYLLAALLLGACASTPELPTKPTMIVMRLEPQKNLPGGRDAFTYRIETDAMLVCGITFGTDILIPSPASLARWEWEVYGNCLDHGGDGRN